MNALSVLSPHRDDAAFSLYLSLRRWGSQGLKLSIINFFTLSAYAPRANSEDRSTVSFLRRMEDRRAIRLASNDIKVEALDLLDAPLRLGIDADAVCQTEPGTTDHSDGLESLATRIQRYSKRGLVLAPLALGSHVDHLIVNAAAITGSAGPRLGFYEDLPYATWTSETSIRERVSHAEARTRVSLKPAIIGADNFVFRKRHAIAYYRSQIRGAEALIIAGFGMKYGGGERIWIPKHSWRWKLLTR